MDARDAVDVAAVLEGRSHRCLRQVARPHAPPLVNDAVADLGVALGRLGRPALEKVPVDQALFVADRVQVDVPFLDGLGELENGLRRRFGGHGRRLGLRRVTLGRDRRRRWRRDNYPDRIK